MSNGERNNKAKLLFFVQFNVSAVHAHEKRSRSLPLVTRSDFCCDRAHIVAWVALLSHNVKVEKWLLMQCIKEESTLRVSPKGYKPSPRVVFRFGNQNNEIKNFLAHRKQIKRITKRLQACVIQIQRVSEA